VCVWSSCTGGRQGLEGRGDHREKESAALGGSGGALGPGGGELKEEEEEKEEFMC